MSLDEEYDDSNILNGDGCDRTSRLEKQFICKDSVWFVHIKTFIYFYIKPDLLILILISADDQCTLMCDYFNYHTTTYSQNLAMIQIFIRMLKQSF